MTELESIAAALATGDGVSVLATLMHVDGSAYRGPGARMVVRADGTTIGAISGGCLEKDIIAHAGQVRAEGTARTILYDLTRDDATPWATRRTSTAVTLYSGQRVSGSALDRVWQGPAPRDLERDIAALDASVVDPYGA